LRAQRRTTVSHEEYAQMRARNRRLAGADGIDAALARHRLHAIASLTSGPAWLTDLVTGDHDTQSNSQAAAVAGYPHITVPAGYVHGLPIGLSFFASAFSEPVLIGLAYAFEQTTRVREPPRFLHSANIDTFVV
jgi:amidase